MGELFERNPEFWVRHEIGAGTSIWFRGNPPFESSKKHMFFVLGVLPDSSFVMVNATSNVEDTLFHLQKAVERFGLSAGDVSVYVNPGDYDFITRSTLIDCFHFYVFRPEDILKGNFREPLKPPAPDALFRQLVGAWLRGPRVTPYLKKPFLE